MEPSFLQNLYLSKAKQPSTILEEKVSQYLQFKNFSVDEKNMEEFFWTDLRLHGDDRCMGQWRTLLEINILYDLISLPPNAIAEKVRFYERQPWNQSSQYIRALIAVNHVFAKMPALNIGPQLLESGAALINLDEYQPWLSLPYAPYHYEFGIFLFLIGAKTHSNELIEAALRIAHWQINTLNFQAEPSSGLFAREKESTKLNNYCLSYLLFRFAFAEKNQAEFAALAASSLKNLQKIAEETDETIPSLWVLIEAWMGKNNKTSSSSHTIKDYQNKDVNEVVYDPSTALSGIRNESIQAVCTLHGNHTGLGELKFEDIHFVNYGPQYLPLENCLGFGIEGNTLTDHGLRRTMIEARKGYFNLKGCVRMVDQPVLESNSSVKFRGIWVEIEQEFKKNRFQLSTCFLSLDGWNDVAFSFFVKAKECKIGHEVLLPQTLNRYEGSVKNVTLKGLKKEVEIMMPFSFEGKMQVIPLAGDDNFWGADFLIAYSLTNEQAKYHWTIETLY